MHNKTFSWQRVLLLLRQDWYNIRSFILFTLVGSYASMIGFMLYQQSQKWARLNLSSLGLREELVLDMFFYYIEYFPLYFGINLFACCSVAYANHITKQGTSWHLGLPGSLNEKWLSKIILFLIITPVLISLIFLLIANVHMVFISTKGHAVRWIMPHDLQVLAYVVPIWVFGASIFLISSWQPRYTWAKALVFLVGILFIFFFVGPFISTRVSGLPFMHTFQDPAIRSLPSEIWDLSRAENDFLQTYLRTAVYLFSLCCLVASYFSIREKQV